MIKVTHSKTITYLSIDPPAVLADKEVRMGETDMRAQYEVTNARVDVYDDPERGGPYVDLLGFALTKRGKRAKGATLKVVPTCYVTTMHVDGTVTFSTAAQDALVADVLAAVARAEEPEPVQP